MLYDLYASRIARIKTIITQKKKNFPNISLSFLKKRFFDRLQPHLLNNLTRMFAKYHTHTYHFKYLQFELHL